MERARVRRGAPPPLRPGRHAPGSSSKRGCLVGYSPHGAVHRARRSRQDRAMRRKRDKDTPTSPRPSPPLIHFPQSPGARSASLAFAPCGARGRRGRVPPARPASPLRSPGPLGPDGATARRTSTCAGARCAYARSQASGASARRLRDKKKLGEGQGEVGLWFARCFAATCVILSACATMLLRPRPHMRRPRPYEPPRLSRRQLRLSHAAISRFLLAA